MSWMRFAPKEWTKAHRKLCWGKGGLADHHIPFLTEDYVEVDGWTFKYDILVTPNIWVEVDGASHPIESRGRKDGWKDDLLEAGGFEVHRFTDWRINHEFEACVNEVMEAYNAIQ
jgi:hypothetical protein